MPGRRPPENAKRRTTWARERSEPRRRRAAALARRPSHPARPPHGGSGGVPTSEDEGKATRLKKPAAGSTGRRTTNLRKPPHLHTLFVHCLRLSAGPTATRGVRGLTYEAPARGRQFKLPRRTTPRPRQEAPTTAPLARPIASGSAPATPTSPFYPRARPRERWEGEKWPQILPAQPPSRDREARAGGRARVEPLLKPGASGLQRSRRCREFTNTHGNQGSWRRGGAERRRRACAQDAALEERSGEAGS